MKVFWRIISRLVIRRRPPQCRLTSADGELSAKVLRLHLLLLVLVFQGVVGSFAQSYAQTSDSHPPADLEIKGHTPATATFQLIANAIVVHVRLNGRGPYAVLLDSGAVNFISPEIAQGLGLAVGEGEEGLGIGRRTVMAGETELDSVQLGNAVLHGQGFHVISLPYVMQHGFPEPIVGGLGYEVLEQVASASTSYASNFRFGMVRTFSTTGEVEQYPSFCRDTYQLQMAPLTKSPAPSRSTRAPKTRSA